MGITVVEHSVSVNECLFLYFFEQKNLASKLELLLHKGGDEGVTKVHIEHITEDKTTGQ